MQEPADDIRTRKYSSELNDFYDEVAAHLDGVQSLLIFGPGEAKTELRKRISGKHSGGSQITLETADRMTEPQVVAEVRRHFQTA